MTAKELLNRIREIRRAIDYRQIKIEGLNERAMRTTSSLNGMPRRGGGDTSAMETAICEKIDLQREVADLQAERNELIKKINEMGDDTLSMLLYLRYVRGFQWETITEKMGYSERSVYRLHRKALELLDNKLNKL